MVRPQPGGVENEVSRLFLHSEEEIFMKFYHNNYSIMKASSFFKLLC